MSAKLSISTPAANRSRIRFGASRFSTPAPWRISPQSFCNGSAAFCKGFILKFTKLAAFRAASSLLFSAKDSVSRLRRAAISKGNAAQVLDSTATKQTGTCRHAEVPATCANGTSFEAPTPKLHGPHDADGSHHISQPWASCFEGL